MRVNVETLTHTMTGRVLNLIDGEDVFDGVFVMVDEDDGTRLKVHGYNCDVEIIPACAAIGAPEGAR